MSPLTHPLTVSALAHVLILFGFGVRIVTRQTTPGAAFAWLLLIVMLPFVGALLYLLIGERRISPQREHRFETLRQALAAPDGLLPQPEGGAVDWSRHPPAAAGLGRLGLHVAASPTIGGSEIELFSDSRLIFESIARDVDEARTAVSMAFYIWSQGGGADRVLEAVERAARRGVACRVLVDALGSRPWLQGRQPARLREVGVEVRAALPIGILRSFVGRIGMRLHRKLVIIDDSIAWTGSMNLVDPRFFKQGAGVGQWVDAMARLRGSAVAPLATTVLGDWMLETGTPIAELAASAGLRRVEHRGGVDIQVVPSGPGESGDGLLQMLLAFIAAAREELTITTPYLVPDESLLRALRGAAGRGVAVTVIIPERVDSILARHASHSCFDALLDAGVEILLYRKGLLHTKSMVADEAMSMFGTVNFDMRSVWLNYEVALFVYDDDFARELHGLQQSYAADSRRLDASEWAGRSGARRFLENAFRLLSPIL